MAPIILLRLPAARVIRARIGWQAIGAFRFPQVARISGKGVVRISGTRMAGAIAAALTLLAPITYAIASIAMSRSEKVEAVGGLASFGAVVYMLVFLILAIPVGAGFGALAAFAQRRLAAQRPR